MALKQVIEIHELLDNAYVTGEKVASFFRERGVEQVEVRPIAGPLGKTDFVKLRIPGVEGKAAGRGHRPWESSVGWAESEPGLT